MLQHGSRAAVVRQLGLAVETQHGLLINSQGEMIPHLGHSLSLSLARLALLTHVFHFSKPLNNSKHAASVRSVGGVCVGCVTLKMVCAEKWDLSCKIK